MPLAESRLDPIRPMLKMVRAFTACKYRTRHHPGLKRNSKKHKREQTVKGTFTVSMICKGDKILDLMGHVCGGGRWEWPLVGRGHGTLHVFGMGRGVVFGGLFFTWMLCEGTIMWVLRASAFFGQCRALCSREPLFSLQSHQYIGEHAQHHSLSLLCSTDTQSILANTNGNNEPQVSKTPPFNNRFCRLMTDQISRALRVIAKHVRSALGPTTLGSDPLTKGEEWDNILYACWRNTQVSDAKVVYTINKKIGPYTGIWIVRTSHSNGAL